MLLYFFLDNILHLLHINFLLIFAILFLDPFPSLFALLPQPLLLLQPPNDLFCTIEISIHFPPTASTLPPLLKLLDRTPLTEIMPADGDNWISELLAADSAFAGDFDGGVGFQGGVDPFALLPKFLFLVPFFFQLPARFVVTPVVNVDAGVTETAVTSVVVVFA